MLRGRQTGRGSTSLADGRPGGFLARSWVVLPCVTLRYLVRRGKPFPEKSIGGFLLLECYNYVLFC